MRNAKLIALVTVSVCAALGVGYIGGRRGASEAMAPSPPPAAALPAGPSSLPVSPKKSAKPRHIVASSVANASLPPKDMPLKNALAELRARANAGDADAASRLAHDLNKCLRVDDIKRTMPQILPFVLSDDDKKLTAEQLSAREKSLGYYQKELDLVRDNDAFCTGIGREELTTMTPTLLRAAQLGDLAATECYLGGGLYDTPGLLDHPEWLSDFKQNALSLVNSAVERGDWVAIGLLEHAYAGFFQSQFLTQLMGPDPAMAYRYLRLQRLGASGDFVDKLDKQIGGVAQNLTPQQIADGDAWAEDTYAKYFNGSSSNDLSNGVNTCNGMMDD